MISNNGSILYGMAFNDIRCLSTDEKPTDNIKNGSVITEIDTGKQYMFDATNKIWHEYKSKVDISPIPDVVIHGITGVQDGDN